jgi:hypothetical protein
MCRHTLRVSSYYYMNPLATLCVLILLYVSSYYHISSVLAPPYPCPRPACECVCKCAARGRQGPEGTCCHTCTHSLACRGRPTSFFFSLCFSYCFKVCCDAGGRGLRVLACRGRLSSRRYTAASMRLGGRFFLFSSLFSIFSFSPRRCWRTLFCRALEV